MAKIKITNPHRNPAHGIVKGEELKVEITPAEASDLMMGEFFHVVNIEQDFIELEESTVATPDVFHGKTAIIDGIEYQILDGKLVRKS